MPSPKQTRKKSPVKNAYGRTCNPGNLKKPLVYGKSNLFQCYPVTKPKNKPSNVPKMGEPSKKRKTRRYRK